MDWTLEEVGLFLTFESALCLPACSAWHMKWKTSIALYQMRHKKTYINLYVIITRLRVPLLNQVPETFWRNHKAQKFT